MAPTLLSAAIYLGALLSALLLVDGRFDFSRVKDGHGDIKNEWPDFMINYRSMTNEKPGNVAPK